MRQVWQAGRRLYRPMPWRDDPRPYYVLVSEVMLQQTQVARVLPAFVAFVRRFPDEVALAAADLDQVLAAWQGLGYNRRGRFLHQAAQVIVGQHQGVMPTTLDGLRQLPGVGAATAGAIMNYAYQVPTPFVETNIRTVYLHHFLADRSQVDDREITTLVAATLDRDRPRQWFWALMDYGSHLKQTNGGRLAQSRHHRPQTRFAGSLRQMRGEILRRYLAGHSPAQLAVSLGHDERFAPALAGLRRDGLVPGPTP